MARIKMTVGNGIEKYTSQLEKMEREAPESVGKAVYQGAKIVADAVKKNIESLPVTSAEKWHKGATMSGLTQTQKDGLEEGFGIADMREDGTFLNVKLGMDGYNGQVTKKYPKGQPNAMIARTLESGSSFRQKHPFIAPAVRSTKGAAEKKMAQVIDEECARIMK